MSLIYKTAGIATKCQQSLQSHDSSDSTVSVDRLLCHEQLIETLIALLLIRNSTPSSFPTESKGEFLKESNRKSHLFESNQILGGVKIRDLDLPITSRQHVILMDKFTYMHLVCVAVYCRHYLLVIAVWCTDGECSVSISVCPVCNRSNCSRDAVRCSGCTHRSVLTYSGVI